VMISKILGCVVWAEEWGQCITHHNVPAHPSPLFCRANLTTEHGIYSDPTFRKKAGAKSLKIGTHKIQIVPNRSRYLNCFGTCTKTMEIGITCHPLTRTTLWRCCAKEHFGAFCSF
jgi:hypothetical protein